MYFTNESTTVISLLNVDSTDIVSIELNIIPIRSKDEYGQTTSNRNGFDIVSRLHIGGYCDQPPILGLGFWTPQIEEKLLLWYILYTWGWRINVRKF